MIVRCLVTLFFEYYRADNRTTVAGAINTVRLLLMLAGVALSVIMDHGVLGILQAQLAAEALVALMLAIQFFRKDILILSRQLQMVGLADAGAYSFTCNIVAAAFLIKFSCLM
jgi:hypothetical protein